ncbi:MAG: ribonuclease R [Bacteroidaceae bacterium]|nr:ribonuclease R [Bacteroidaceae bacterium]
MSKGKNKTTKRITKRQLAERVMGLFEGHPKENFELKAIFRLLNLDTHPAKMLCMDVLEALLQDDIIAEKPRYTYRLKQQSQTLEGTFCRKANGKNTFTPDGGGRPILVAERNSLHAMDGDRVQVTMMARRKNHVREGMVTEILKRADRKYVGRLEAHRDLAFLITEDRTLANDIIIPRQHLHGARNGDKVVVRIAEWPVHAKNPIGRVVDVLGEAGDNTTEMHAILAEYGLPYRYPQQVEEAANRIPAEIPEEEIRRREDMRQVMTFTIDPRDAKDFDDAISIRKVGVSMWEVGVHIADVSHYVQEGSIIDREAQRRGTSIYLVDRTVPMLPERLCNNICSLRPDEDKLTYSVIFLMNERAEVKDWHLAKTVTRSNRRFIYEEVQQVLEAHGEASPEDYQNPGDHMAPECPDYEPAEHFADELITLNRMARQLRQRRFQEGAVDFDRQETRFEIDPQGRPLNVYFKVAKDANKLVEEFMLLANRTVAESIGKQGKSSRQTVNGKPVSGKSPKVFVYRIHEQPDENKLMNLSEFVLKFGLKLKPTGSNKTVSQNINRMLHDVKGRREQNLVEMVTLKAMMKAKYSTQNIGHYGLAFDYYTHFTSPIRRYPDLMVHRLLFRYAEGGRSVMKGKYEELCEHASQMEQTAVQAERASIKYKEVEFMQERIGQEFQGTISGVTEYGLFVEIDENKCEGLVPLRDLDDDYYELDEKNYCLWGRRHHRRYSLGDQVRIRIASANLERKQLNFTLVK